VGLMPIRISRNL